MTFKGQKVIEAGDESFTEAGKVGVWTKADSVTLFDDFTKALGTKRGAGLNAPQMEELRHGSLLLRQQTNQ